MKDKQTSEERPTSSSSTKQNGNPCLVDSRGIKREPSPHSPSLLADCDDCDYDTLTQIFGPQGQGDLRSVNFNPLPEPDRSVGAMRSLPTGDNEDHEELSLLRDDTQSTYNTPVTPTAASRRLFQSDASRSPKTPTSHKQSTLDCYFQMRTQCVSPEVSASAESSGASEPSSPALTRILGNKKRKSGNATVEKTTPAKKRNTRQTKNLTPSSSTSTPRRSRNSSGKMAEVELQNDESNDSFDSDAENRRDTVDHISVHRLPVDELRERFENPDLSEIKLIEQIMDEVNHEISRKYKKDRSIFKTVEVQEDSHSNAGTFDFAIRPYVQKVEHGINILSSLGIFEDGLKKVEINFIIFYHRENNIYALTTNQTWQTIQRYCCYDFPCLISGRLTKADGTVEEVAKPLAGNKRKLNTTKKNATMANPLKNVILNWTKEVRQNSSLFKLKEFANIPASRRRLLIQFGLAYVRIKRRMDLKNLPEILDHFTKICNGEPTYALNDREEKQIPEFPYIRPIDRKDMAEVESSFYELIKKFMHKQHSDLIRKFDFVDKHINDFCNAEDFELFYKKPGFDVVKYLTYPTAYQVLADIRLKYGTDLLKNEASFTNRFKRDIKIRYFIRGKSECIRRVVDLLEGEMVLNGKEYWKIMGTWFSVSDDYHFQICKEFRDLLNRPGIFVVNEQLPKPWNKSEILSVKEYVRMYENQCINNFYYYLPPSSQVMAEQSSQSLEETAAGNEDDGERSEAFSSISTCFREQEGNFFDLLRVRKNETGQFLLSLFYIFDGFDSGIRDASTRITKSIDILLKDDAPITTSKSLLEKFWDYQVQIKQDAQFKAFFPEFDIFRQLLTTGENVSVCVAFATQPRPREVTCGPLDSYVSRQQDLDEVCLTGTLDREKNLKLNFNLDNIRQLLELIKLKDEETLNQMCRELGLDALFDSEDQDRLMDLLTTKVLGLITEEYCLKKSMAVADTDMDIPVAGKLLRIRNPSNFVLFKGEDVNKTFFNTLSQFYITGFPGFVNKLECFQIYEDVSKVPRLHLNFLEIK